MAAFGVAQDANADEWDKHLDGLFVGGSLGVALPATWKTGGEAFTSSFRIGWLTRDDWQITIDISPGTLLLNQGDAPLGLFEAGVTIGGLVPIGENVGWIFRFGVSGGVVLGRAPPPNISPSLPLGFVELRGDFFGVAIRTGKKTMFEFNAPSFRAVVMPSSTSDLLYMAVINVAFHHFLF
jgi:hypothetical protein